MSEWKLKRGEEEWAVGTAATLKEWAGKGLIAQDDYVFNPILEKWVYARDVAEISPTFSVKVARERKEWVNHASWVMFLLSVILLFVSPILAACVFFVAILFAVAYYVMPK